MARPARVFISAGETSGDRFGAALVDALLRRRPDLDLAGLGGPAMAARGVRLIENPLAHASMGFSGLSKVGAYLSIFRRCISHFRRLRPDVFVPIDNPEFNLRFAGYARAMRVPVCYYVSPQVWAWRRRRIHRIAATVNRMLCILPFEKEMYDRVGCDARYVGHPALDYLAAARLDEETERRIRSLGPLVVGLLPGSRGQEVERVFPIIAGAAAIVQRAFPEARFAVGCAEERHVASVRSVLRAKGVQALILPGRAWEVMRQSRLCVAASGTVTLELAWFRRPMVIVYHGPWVVKPFLPWILHTRFGLVNVIAGQEICPEHLMFTEDPRPAAEAALRLLRNEQAWAAQQRDLDDVMRTMGGPGTSDRAAEAVLEVAGVPAVPPAE
jgi:lipid-A-disaccharide synthase